MVAGGGPSRSEYGRRLAAGSLLNAGGAAVGAACQLAFVALVAERIGASAFGVFVLAVGWTQLPWLLESGVGQELVRRSGSRTDSDDGLVRVAAAMYLAAGAATALLGIVVARALLSTVDLGSHGLDLPTARHAVDILIVAGAVRLGTGFVQRLLLGTTRLGTMRSLDVARDLAMVAGSWLILPDTASGLTNLAWLTLCVEGAVALAGIASTRACFSGRGDSRQSLRLLLRVSGPITVVNLTALLSNRFDPFIAAGAAGLVGAAAYGAAQRLYDIVRSITEMICLVLMPGSAALLADGDRTGVRLLFQRALIYIPLVAWPPALLLLVFSAPLTSLWLESPPSGVNAAVVAAMALSLAIGPPAAGFYVIVGAGRVRAVTPQAVVASVANLAASLALVRPLGVAGLFVGSTVGALLLIPRYVREVAEITASSWQELFAPLARSGAAAATFAACLLGLRIATGGELVPIGVAGCGLVCVAASLRWVVPTADVERLTSFGLRSGRPRT